VVGGSLKRFWYLRRLILSALALALLLSALVAVILAWRSAQKSIEQSARRAVVNAERMIDRTSSDLQKLDALTSRPCDEATIGLLKDAVYGSTSQLREIGLIRDNKLYCTNFGAVSVDMSPIKDSLKVGTFISAGPNAVVANNTSVFVYVTLKAGSTVNGVLNPTLMAEFERSFYLSGRAHLEMRYSGPPASGARVAVSEQVYEIGQSDVKVSAGPAMAGSWTSTRFPLFAEVNADRGIFWDEYWPTFTHLFGIFAPILLVTAFLLDRLLASGALSRVRYKRALKQGQFKVYYQPIVSAQTRRLVGVEALLRWVHPKQGLMRAAQFAQLFDDEMMDEPIARFVLETVAEDFKSASVAAGHIWCSVNVAPALLERPSFATEIAHYANGLAQGQLRIEITERTPVSGAAEITIRELRGHGIKVGLDDFGTGYSNINQLQTLAYDFIKIDGLLIRGVQAVEGLSPVLESVIDLAHKLGTDIVAEGVETLVQAQALSTRNVKNLQGYLFSQAKPFSDILVGISDEQAMHLTISV
jgi:sensor c-di-GMP phosphodiesterase-like protein